MYRGKSRDVCRARDLPPNCTATACWRAGPETCVIRYPAASLELIYMSSASISAVLAGRVPLEQTATVNGWVKTRRDSKAGFSFLAISDGSCFDSIQIVAPNSLPNYTSEILQITTGCAVTCTGKLVRSQGKGQAIEMQADSVQVLGWVENPDAYPVS